MPQELVETIKLVEHVPTMQALALANRYIDNAQAGFNAHREAGNPAEWAKKTMTAEVAKAQGKLTEARQHSPQDENVAHLSAALEAMLHTLQAQGAMVLDDPTGALKHLDAALLIDTKNAGLYADKARCLMRLNRKAEAVTMAETATALEPAEVDYLELVEKIKSTGGFAGFLGSKGGDTAISAAGVLGKGAVMGGKGLLAVGGFMVKSMLKR
jgi:tetratricopeptide (TPR) repeat protein